MLEKTAMMFGADCVKHNPLLPFIITVYDGNIENPQLVAHIDLQFSRIALYDPNPIYLKNMKRLAGDYESMDRRGLGLKREFTIELDYK